MILTPLKIRTALSGLILFALFNSPARSQDQPGLIPFEQAYKRVYTTVRLQGTAPLIDGKLDDEAWKNEGSWSQNFLQNTPVERGQPTYPTRIKILYDDRNIYFALRAWDPEPDKINRFVGNRDDNSIGDLISVAFDTYHDFRAAPEFNINAGGNKTDLIVTDALSVNLNWNAVWEGKTAVNDSSWTVEFKIPFNQLRFNKSDSGMVWGLHVRRIVRRIQETDQWSLIPRKNSGHVYSFGTMEGLKDIPKPRLIEFLPYVAGKATSAPVISGSPYSKNPKWNGYAGLDSKIGVGDYTMDITVNPDFGQIEADPSVMNLTALETFYDEKRPFFLEGKHIFDFSADNNLMFYSRRIGHVPSYTPQVDNVNSFYQSPEFTNIIDAFKFSGTTKNGISAGFLQSLTQKEYAKITSDGTETEKAVEPLTNFLVERIQKTANNGNTQIGAMLTSTYRFINDEHLEYLPKSAYTAGVDMLLYSKEREYYLDFKGMMSYLTGDEKAMINLQRNALHYYQRPDAAGYLGVDSTRRSLSGTGGYLSAGRLGNKRFIFSEKLTWWSPGFDINDVGYLLMADVAENLTQLGIRQTEPKKLLRNYTLTAGQKNGWTFGGLSTYNDAGLQFRTQFTNRMDLSVNESYVFSEMNTRLLRGGPAFRLSPYWKNSISFNTNKSKRIIFSLDNNSLLSSDGVSKLFSVQPGISLRMGNHVYFISNFRYTRNTDNFIYVTQKMSGDDLRYILGKINQETYSMTFRLNYNITPDLSVQYYGSPFVSSGKYDDFKRAEDTHSRIEDERYHSFTESEISYDEASNNYTVTEGSGQYSFKNPDFSFRQFRSNLVAKWEYRLGSFIYLVWSREKTGFTRNSELSAGESYRELRSVYPENIFLVKLNYWFSL
ncbi:MAG: carbohydrate binding family 9 domain-containing protein [Bacteroidales bacterium]|nr:carbohydrate binding family 9 domain-containing protein [Bacteroidales bacterium]